jgi:hypothetical protein
MLLAEAIGDVAAIGHPFLRQNTSISSRAVRAARPCLQETVTATRVPHRRAAEKYSREKFCDLP